jgi:regulator of protease activity HflC (stomatin/prohibitin superfamily)
MPAQTNDSPSYAAVGTQEPPNTTDAPIQRTRLRRWLWRRIPYIFIALLLIVLTLLFLWSRIVIIIDSGQAGVLFRLLNGTQIDYVYQEGLHLISPLNTMNIYETRKQIALHEFDVLTVKGLNVRLSLAIRYQPEVDLLGMLHQRIGPDYLKRVIIPQTESVMRKQLGKYTAEDIYTNKEGLLTNAILLALDEVGRNFVKVEDIIIRSIQLPDKIKVAIEDKLTQEELLKSYEFRTRTAKEEAERLRIEGEGLHQYHEIIDKSLNDRILQHQGILATRELAKSNNAKVIVIGSGKNGLPLILNAQ